MLQDQAALQDSELTQVSAGNSKVWQELQHHHTGGGVNRKVLSLNAVTESLRVEKTSRLMIKFIC